MKLGSINEWDRLRVAIVGTVSGFSPGLEAGAGMESVLERARRIALRAFPQAYLDEVAEDLEGLCAALARAGVMTLRPQWSEQTSHFATPNWCASGFDAYNVRDLHAVFGETLVVSASPSRFRLFETYALQDLFYTHFFADGFRWLSAPLPRLRGRYRHQIERTMTPLELREDMLHVQMSGGVAGTFHRLDETEVLFDAANVIRLGRDVLFLVSSTGNHRGAQWLQHALGCDYRVHITSAYRSSHLDSTILPLREGVVLLNAARVNDANLPDVLGGWEKIYFSDVASVPDEESVWHRDIRTPVFHELQNMGVQSTLEHMSSPWAGLNVLSVDESTVFVHDRQAALIRVLERRGFTVVPIRMRHCYTMLGGLHCTTLDAVRTP